MKNLYTILAVLLSFFFVPDLIAQTCATLAITSAVPGESRCMATGTITVTATGGSGSYNYKVTGPTNTPYTSSSVITGLSAGTYDVTVQDVTLGCTVQLTGIVINGSYVDPRFTLVKTDETCLNKSDGTISLSSSSGGRAPYTYSIVAPSPFGVGISNSTGTFTGLPGGDYSIEMKDSCGGIQTRRITLLGYDWWIDFFDGNRTTCSDADFQIHLRDSRGEVNTLGTTFAGFQYGVVNAPGDTSWYSTYNFTHTIGTNRFVTLVVKDLCGNVKMVRWVNSVIPSVANLVTTTYQSCNSFTATITGQANLTNPTYCLYNSANTLLGCNATGMFSGIQEGAYYITVKDICFDTTITRLFSLSRPKPSADPNVSVNQVNCSSFNVSVTGVINFINPDYCLYDAANTLITCNTTGVFNSLSAGAYCVRIKDACYDTTVSRCFTLAVAKPDADANVKISNRQCSGFDAGITGQTNLFNADYCLYTSLGALISCNKTGSFSNIPYGSYCIKITGDAACYDTTFERCFDVLPVKPSVDGDPKITRNCNTIDIKMDNYEGFVNPQFCLYDGANNLIGCNLTGIFNGLPYGSYCMDIKNDISCYDTTVRKCFTAVQDKPGIGALVSSNQDCTGFDISVSGKTSLNNPLFTLKNSLGVVIATNTTGVFTNIPYGDYSVEMQNDAGCYDTLITRFISASLPKPDAGILKVTSRNCGGFSAKILWISHFNSPTFTLLDASGTVIATNVTGQFSNIPYGDYCVNIKDACYDTTITRCVTGVASAVTFNVSASPSCDLNATNLKITVTNAQPPYTVSVYDHENTLVNIITSGSSTIRFYGLPGLPPGGRYKVVLTDNCGNAATKMVTPIVSTFSSTLSIVPKCPSGTYQNGSSELTITVGSNLGTIRPVIIRKDGAVVNILYNTSTTTVYRWIDLEPATYVVQYNLPGSCTNKAYDTVSVGPYQYPQLDKAASYQCDNNSFSVNAHATGGVGPYTYEIIGSVPAAPSIVTAPQASPYFNINNGSTYSLIRLRVVDYCGNATLNDVSVLPLQNLIVSASSDCYYGPVTLSVDSVLGASYSWYFKTSPTDSVLVSNSRSYDITYLTPAEIGTYVVKTDVSGGCLNRLNYYTLTGACSTVLAGKIVLAGKPVGADNYLQWNHLSSGDVASYVVEKRVQGGSFIAIGQIIELTSTAGKFGYADPQTDAAVSEYRIKAIDKGGKIIYSNTITIKRGQQAGQIQVYPNPVSQVINISFPKGSRSDYLIQLLTASGQSVFMKEWKGVSSGSFTINRNASMKPGIYFLRIVDKEGGQTQVVKLIFE